MGKTETAMAECKNGGGLCKVSWQDSGRVKSPDFSFKTVSGSFSLGAGEITQLPHKPGVSDSMSGTHVKMAGENPGH